MFKSTTLKLTGWYITIIMLISIIFSIAIYGVAFNEVQARLDNFKSNISSQSHNVLPKPIGMQDFRNQEVENARSNLSINLVYVNLLILVVGGFGSYFLARRSIKPIEEFHKAESRFTSDASHELRTPLAVMKTEIEVALRDKSANVNDLKQILNSNLEEVEKLSKLSEMLLDLSRLDNSKIKVKFKPINIVEICTEIINDLKIPNNRIATNLPKKLIIDGNEQALLDLIKVLIENALIYSPSDSLISINISSTSEYAIFEITNTGAGIPKEKLPYIFDRFYQVDSSRTGNKGFGLGLALAKRIVELHNGEILVSSEPDHATIFTVKLPLPRKQ